MKLYSQEIQTKRMWIWSRNILNTSFGIDSQNMGEVEKLVGEFVVEGLRNKFKPK